MPSGLKHTSGATLIRQYLIPILVSIPLVACKNLNGSINSDDPPSLPVQGEYAPRPPDSNLLRGEVFLDSIDLLAMESYPLQFAVVLAGTLPTPCHELRVAVSLPDGGKNISMDVYSITDPEKTCIGVLEPLKVNIPLGSYPSGHYSLWVKGEMITEFDS